MVIRRSMDAARSYLASQMRDRRLLAEGYRVERGRPVDAPPPQFVTISREAGAGGYTIADLLSGILTEREVGRPETPWAVFDREILDKVVEDHDIPDQYMRDVEERSVPEIQAIVEELFGVRVPTRSLVHMTSRAILHIACLGNAIIIGRGGNIVTRKLTGGLHVRLIGSPEGRIRTLMITRELTREDARELRDAEDYSRGTYVRRYFDQDVDDAHLYDLVIDADRLGFEGSAQLVAEALALKAARTASMVGAA